ncbi:ABC transporter permease [Carboxydochorda subterranea]|uniref:ABC transporter permease n=1 Tax=Carboxydichorda subterranea TaxID=3109565 RepID=A0ABZ1C1D7_9FIRM|nr:ABC transporter permease [Limnochorda sp. L945t]WRP18897.1 ABC transporter permease [Limnochorda sp. L945t]
MFTYHANTFNIAMEGMMLAGAFFAVAASYLTGSWAAGVAAAVGAGLLLAALFALVAIGLRCDEFVTGIAINMLALGGTTFLLRLWFNVKGALVSPRIAALPRWHIPGLEQVPFLGDVLSGHAFLVYVTWAAVAAVHWVIFSTRFGLRLRASGESPDAAASLGVSPSRYKYWAALLSGLLSGLAGAYLSLGYVSLFTENMSNGRGWIALAAIILVRARPVPMLLISLLFGFFDGMGMALQGAKFPAQLTHMLPYLATLLALYSYARTARRRRLAEGVTS